MKTRLLLITGVLCIVIGGLVAFVGSAFIVFGG